MSEDERAKAVKISISLPSDLAEKTEDYAEETGKATSQIVQQALKKFLEPELEEDTLWEDRIEESIKEVKSSLKQIGSKLQIESEEEEKTEEEIEEPEEEIEESSKKTDILRLFEDCIKTSFDEEDGFEIEGEDGFLEQVKARNLTGEVWTKETLNECAKHLKFGYDGYFEKPNRTEFLERVSKTMKLSKAQKGVLTNAFESCFESLEEEEEDEW